MGKIAAGEGNNATILTDANGSKFVASFNSYPGESYSLNIGLTNASSEPIKALPIVDAPEGFSVRAEFPDLTLEVTDIAPIRENTWILEVAPLQMGAINQIYLVLEVAVSSAVVPGYYNLSYQIDQVSLADLD